MVDTVQNSALIRTDLWSQEIKDVLQEELSLDTYIRWITDFPDGDTLHIPTFAELTTHAYSEGAPITLQDITNGDFTLTIDKYYESGFRVTDKFRQDSFYVGQIQANFIPKLTRALLEQKESDIAHLQAGQTASDPNTINTVDHRYVATGTSGVIALKDVAKAKLSLDKGRTLRTNRRAIVDPTVSYQLTQIDNVIRQDTYGANSNIREGMSMTTSLGMYLGFQFYESLFLDYAVAETIVATGQNSGSKTATSAFANMFCAEEAFIGAMRSAPDFKSKYDLNTRSDIYHITIRYGIKLFRPESLVVILTENA